MFAQMTSWRLVDWKVDRFEKNITKRGSGLGLPPKSGKITLLALCFSSSSCLRLLAHVSSLLHVSLQIHGFSPLIFLILRMHGWLHTTHAKRHHLLVSKLNGERIDEIILRSLHLTSLLE